MGTERTFLEDAVVKQALPRLHGFDELGRCPLGFAVLRLLGQTRSKLVGEHQEDVLVLPAV